jgi:hypothetical protein
VAVVADIMARDLSELTGLKTLIDSFAGHIAAEGKRRC